MAVNHRARMAREAREALRDLNIRELTETRIARQMLEADTPEQWQALKDESRALTQVFNALNSLLTGNPDGNT